MFRTKLMIKLIFRTIVTEFLNQFTKHRFQCSQLQYRETKNDQRVKVLTIFPERDLKS